MSEREARFDVGDRPRIEVQLGAGGVYVVPGDSGTVTIRLRGSERALERFHIDQRADTVVVFTDRTRGRGWSSVDVTAEIPANTEVVVRAGSADVRIETAVRGLEVGIGAGDVDAGDVTGDARLRTAAGDARLGSVSGRLEVAAAAGDLRVDRVGGDLRVATASGDVAVGSAEGRVDVKTASGDVAIDRFAGPEFVGRSLSGDLRLGIPAGFTLDVDITTVSGDIANELVPDPDAERIQRASLRYKAMSGDVTLVPARTGR